MNEDIEQAALDDLPPDSAVETTNETEEVITDPTAGSEEETATTETQEVTEVSKEQKALNQLAFEKREEKRQRIAVQEELDNLKAQIPAQPEAKGEPKLEDFEYDEQAFNAALINYRVEEGLKTVTQKQAEQREEDNRKALESAFQARGAKLAQSIPNYIENLSNLPEFPDETLGTILSMEGGNEVANYLGAHANIADEVALLNPIQAAVKLGQISTQLSMPKPIKTSAAPEPIEPVTASGSLNKSYEDMSMEELMNADT